MTDQDKIAVLEARVLKLEDDLDKAKSWLSAIYADMLRLQHATAKAMAGDRDAANAIYVEVLNNSKKLQGAKTND